MIQIAANTSPYAFNGATYSNYRVPGQIPVIGKPLAVVTDSPDITAPNQAAAHPALDKETRTHVGTACAAHWLNRKPQTLRSWACFEDGPLRPVRINGRLAWAVADIRRVLAGGAC